MYIPVFQCTTLSPFSSFSSLPPSLPLPVSSRDIQQLLSVSFAHSDPSFDPKDSYLLLVARDPGESVGLWTGKTVEMKTSAETTIAISEIKVGEGGGGESETEDT